MALTYPQAVRIMANASPGRVFVALRDLLAEQAWEARLWIADYRQTALRSLDDVDGEHEHIQVNDSWQGRVFASGRAQAPAGEDGHIIGLPVSHRGNRLGVLQVSSEHSLTDAEVADLAEVAGALGHEITLAAELSDRYEQARRARPLTVAAEMQWALLPATAHTEDRYAIAGLLEPAYSIAGDAFDWVCEPDHLMVAVCDGNNRGVPAAMATTLAMTALRNGRRAGVPLAEQASLADQALYAHYSGSSFVAALLMRLDLATGLLSVVDAGSPQLLRVRGGQIRLIELDAQLPLGMFEETLYREQVVDLSAGDRLVVVSDGVHAAPAGAPFGDAALAAAVSSSRLLSAQETVRHIVAALREHHHGAELDDDAVLMCIDWNGTAE
jgi:serine phosphatase RsbU (regulator of sigma subunit)